MLRRLNAGFMQAQNGHDVDVRALTMRSFCAHVGGLASRRFVFHCKFICSFYCHISDETNNSLLRLGPSHRPR